MSARRPGEKEIAETAGPASNQSGLEEQDVEDGLDAVDIDRIEKVYRFVSLRLYRCIGSNDM